LTSIIKMLINFHQNTSMAWALTIRFHWFIGIDLLTNTMAITTSSNLKYTLQ